MSLCLACHGKSVGCAWPGTLIRSPFILQDVSADRKQGATPSSAPAPCFEVEGREAVEPLEETKHGGKSAVLSKAQALTRMAMGLTAEPLWGSAASVEERIAPLLDAQGNYLDAATS
jgi:hypothetical protein